MARRGKAGRRDISPDGKYSSRSLQMFINKVMIDGKKSTAERIVYGALERMEEQQGRPALDIFDQALRNATPAVEVKPRRVGGATYQVPVDIRAERRVSLAMRWLVRSARARRGRSMAEKLAGELLDASTGQGATVKRREDTHRMAEANRAFVHYRW
jgi:small subunit ribosomal protein S7